MEMTERIQAAKEQEQKDKAAGVAFLNRLKAGDINAIDEAGPGRGARGPFGTWRNCLSTGWPSFPGGNAPGVGEFRFATSTKSWAGGLVGIARTKKRPKSWTGMGPGHEVTTREHDKTYLKRINE